MKITSYVARQAHQLKLTPLKIPHLLRPRFCLVSADNAKKTEEELMLKRQAAEPFVTGFLYADHQKKVYNTNIVKYGDFFFAPPARLTM